MAGNRRSARHADNPAGRAAQNRVLALKHMGIRQAAGRLHEKQFDARHLAGHLLHIPPQYRRQVGIHHGGVAPADKLHHRAGFMRGADLGKTKLAGNPARCLFVRRVPVAMHKNNRNAAQPFLVLRKQLFF